MAFENGQISWIEKNWGAFSGRVSPVEVTKALYSAMESAKISSGLSTEISTNVKQDHGSEFKSVHFIFPDRKIIVVTTNGNVERGQHVRIYERVDGNDAQHYDNDFSSAESCNPSCPDTDPIPQNSKDYGINYMFITLQLNDTISLPDDSLGLHPYHDHTSSQD